MLFLAAIIFAGSMSTSLTQAHGTFPQTGRGTVVGTRVVIDRRFPPVIAKPNAAAANLVRAQELKREQQDACSRFKLHRLVDGPANRQQPLRCAAGPGAY